MQKGLWKKIPSFDSGFFGHYICDGGVFGKFLSRPPYDPFNYIGAERGRKASTGLGDPSNLVSHDGAFPCPCHCGDDDLLYTTCGSFLPDPPCPWHPTDAAKPGIDWSGASFDLFSDVPHL